MCVCVCIERFILSVLPLVYNNMDTSNTSEWCQIADFVVANSPHLERDFDLFRMGYKTTTQQMLE